MNRHCVRVFTDNPTIVEETIKHIDEKCGLSFPQVNDGILTVSMYCTDGIMNELKRKLLTIISPRLFVIY